jgi:hypothetical protein
MSEESTAPGDKMLERVRRLLAKAEGASSEAERDAYNAKAAELIARYGIEEALLAEDRHEHLVPGDLVVDLDPPYARDKGSLLGAIAGPLRVRVVMRRTPARLGSSRAPQLSMHLFGMQADLQRVDLLYTSLLVQAAHGIAVARPDDPFESVAAYRRSWMIGFAAVIQERLYAAESTVAAEADARRRGSAPAGAAPRSTSLVLADRSQLVDAAVAAAYPRLRTARGRYLSGSGADAGAAAARRADLGDRRLARGGRRALS